MQLQLYIQNIITSDWISSILFSSIHSNKTQPCPLFSRLHGSNIFNKQLTVRCPFVNSSLGTKCWNWWLQNPPIFELGTDWSKKNGKQHQQPRHVSSSATKADIFVCKWFQYIYMKIVDLDSDLPDDGSGMGKLEINSLYLYEGGVNSRERWA